VTIGAAHGAGVIVLVVVEPVIKCSDDDVDDVGLETMVEVG